MGTTRPSDDGRHARTISILPIIFSFSSNPIGAGAGRTYDDHLPNVTGVPATAAYEDVLGLIYELLPNARRLGTLVVPAEVNSVFNTKRLFDAAVKQGFELVTVPVNSSSELSDSTLALLAQNVDAICQVGSNLTISGFASIVRSAQQAHVPVFGFLTSDAKNGAEAAVASPRRAHRRAGSQECRAGHSPERGSHCP